MSDLDLYADLITRKLVSRDGGAVALSPFVLGGLDDHTWAPLRELLTPSEAANRGEAEDEAEIAELFELSGFHAVSWLDRFA